MTTKIATLTLNPALDKSTAVDHLAPEQKLRCGPLQLDAGGGGINVSKAIHRLGGQAVAIFPAGGNNGKILHDLLEKEGVKTHPLTVGGETRENFSVLETASHAQYRFTLPGLQISEDQADECLDIIKKLNP
ncbi:MAG: PfkB family carbohydrate kinase, partial [Saprospiraceae bacterium]|nr:PfkB family carbohydrate kinase [Saprospiraceae bacterium]